MSTEASAVASTTTAPATRRAVPLLLGQILQQQGQLDASDIERILRFAGRRQVRFGEAAVRLGLVSPRLRDQAVAAQFDYPLLAPGTPACSPELAAAFDPFGREGMAIAGLRNRLSEAWFRAGRRTLAIAAPSTREPSALTAANLAVSFSQQGWSTALVDGAIGQPSLHERFGQPNGPGLSSVLARRCSLGDAVVRLPELRDLSLLTAGPPPPNFADLLWRPELGHVLAALRSRYRIILVACPPGDSGAGTERLARECEGALLVIRRNQTRATAVHRLVTLLDDVKVLGTAFIGR